MCIVSGGPCILGRDWHSQQLNADASYLFLIHASSFGTLEAVGAKGIVSGSEGGSALPGHLQSHVFFWSSTKSHDLTAVGFGKSCPTNPRSIHAFKLNSAPATPSQTYTTCLDSSGDSLHLISTKTAPNTVILLLSAPHTFMSHGVGHFLLGPLISWSVSPPSRWRHLCLPHDILLTLDVLVLWVVELHKLLGQLDCTSTMVLGCLFNPSSLLVIGVVCKLTTGLCYECCLCLRCMGLWIPQCGSPDLIALPDMIRHFLLTRTGCPTFLSLDFSVFNCLITSLQSILRTFCLVNLIQLVHH